MSFQVSAAAQVVSSLEYFLSTVKAVPASTKFMRQAVPASIASSATSAASNRRPGDQFVAEVRFAQLGRCPCRLREICGGGSTGRPQASSAASFRAALLRP